jgi:hypothetical protein
MRTVALLLTSGGPGERVATALKLADRLLARGHRIVVFAHDEAAALSAGAGEVAESIAALLRRGVHGGTLDWVIDEEGARRLGVLGAQVPGVVPGGHGDLWAFVREADIVLTARGR